MRRMQRRGLVSAMFGLMFALVCAACGNSSSSSAAHPPATSPTSIPGVTARRNVAYGPLPAETLDLCYPANATNPRPGIIMIHGGGWAGGDKQQYDDACAFLAQHGFVAATINYRLAPAAHWPAQLVDAQLAVRWLRANAAQTHLDTQRLCSWGDSAGAHLAVFLGVLPTIHAGDEAGMLTTQSSATTCVADDYGPVDLIGPADPLQQQILQNFIGATYQADVAAYRDASPLFLVSAHSPPMLIVQGTQDSLVPQAESLALQAALKAAHVPVQYISFPGGHAFQGLSDSQIQAIMQQIYVYFVNQEHP